MFDVPPTLDGEDSVPLPFTPAAWASHGMIPKSFHDKVHDMIRLPAVLVRVIDTPQFQRLRDLHQLGATQYLFPGANNTRFEHSLGVAHLGMKMIRQLALNHDQFGPALDVTERDVLCIGLAGLCHDLGHGPLSHMFEEFVNAARRKRGIVEEWHHESASIELFDYLIVQNEIDLSLYGLADTDREFVKRLIKGLAPSEPWPTDIGRTENKRYLFEIIANKRNGIDVDKLDYFLRDSLSCYGRLPDLMVGRIVNSARVILCEGQYQICFEEKVALSLGDLFYVRAKLHKFVYQHRITKVVDDMTMQALLAADDHYLIETTAGRKYRLSDTILDMEAYSKTSDWVLRAILATTSPKLAESRRIFTDIHCRRLYKLVGYCDVHSAKPSMVDEIRAAVKAEVREVMPLNNICVLQTKIVYGSSGDQPGANPLSNIRFFNPKLDYNTASAVHVNRFSRLFSPRDLSENTALVFSRDAAFGPAVHEAFQRWLASETAKGDVSSTVPFAHCSPSRHVLMSPSREKRPRSELEPLSLSSTSILET